MKRLWLGVLGVSLIVTEATGGQTLPRRAYGAGEPIAYTMQGVNENPQRTVRYEAHVAGVVRGGDGSMARYENLRWDRLVRDGASVELSQASKDFREPLSLEVGYTLKVPDLSKVQPVLIGPITDLLTFYADVQLALKQSALKRAGDHVYVKHGTTNSWADGRFTLLGQDSIDFDLALVSVDESSHIAELKVRHVPPTSPQITLPAAWMSKPIGESANNWVQLQKLNDGTYAASVGRETFEADIKLSLPSGAILSARLDNPVDVMERDCADETLKSCSEVSRYQIRREITLNADATR